MAASQSQLAISEAYSLAIDASRVNGCPRSFRKAARIAGGVVHTANGYLPIDLDAYAEAGVVGLRRTDVFAGGQAYALYPLVAGDRMRVTAGAAAWASAQHSAAETLSRIEFGPSARLVRRIGGGAVELRIDYRWGIAGDASPGSGPTATIVSRY